MIVDQCNLKLTDCDLTESGLSSDSLLAIFENSFTS